MARYTAPTAMVSIEATNILPASTGGGNLCERTLQRSRTTTPSSHCKYEQAVWANRTLVFPRAIYVERAQEFHRATLAPTLARVSGSRQLRVCRVIGLINRR